MNFSLDCFPNLVLLSCDLILYWEKASEDRYLSFYLHNMGFPCGSAGKESACNVGDLGLIPGLGRSLGEGKGYPLQYPGLETSMDCIFHGVAKSRTQLSKFHLHNIALFCRHFSHCSSFQLTQLYLVIISRKNLLFSESHPHFQLLTSLYLATILVTVSQNLSLGWPDSPLATVTAFNSHCLFCYSPGLHITFYILFHHFSWLSKKSMLR